MRFLVISERHHLLPIAWHLKRKGHDAEAVVLGKRYSKAWRGLMDVTLLAEHTFGKHLDTESQHRLKQWEESREQTARWKEEAQGGELHVITDSERATRFFEGVPNLFGTTTHGGSDATGEVGLPLPGLMAGGWWDGEAFTQPHLLVAEWGLWPGGLGPKVLSGGTLIPYGWELAQDNLDAQQDAVKSLGVKGLVQVGLLFDQDSKDFKPLEPLAGWPWLHSHVYMEWFGFPDIYGGFDQGVVSGPGWLSCTTVSIPPYPLVSNYKPREVEVRVLPDDQRNLMFFDMRADPQEERLWTAGVDGLVALAFGHGATHTTSRLTALQAASRLQGLPEMQVRSDLGSTVDQLVVGLEQLGKL